MEYVLLRYRGRPDDVIDIAATTNPGEAVQIARRWNDRAPDEGLIVTIEQQAVVHCTPRTV